MPSPLPPLVAAYLAGDLPDAPLARRALVHRLDAAARARGLTPPGGRVARSPEAQTAFDVRRDLYVWAHGEAPRRPGETAPTRAAWAAVLGLTVDALHAARRAHPEVAALPVAAHGRPRTSTPSPVTERVRRHRAPHTTPPKRGRPRKKSDETP